MALVPWIGAAQLEHDLLEVDEAGMRVDGNAVAGLMRQTFGRELTLAGGTCASCAMVAQRGVVHVYMRPPGVVARCPTCAQVQMRIVRGPDRCWFDISGIRCLEITTATEVATGGG